MPKNKHTRGECKQDINTEKVEKKSGEQMKRSSQKEDSGIRAIGGA